MQTQIVYVTKVSENHGLFREWLHNIRAIIYKDKYKRGLLVLAALHMFPLRKKKQNEKEMK